MLNAGFPMLVEMAGLCDGKVVFFAADADLPLLAAHRASGQTVVFVRDAQVIVAIGDEETPIVGLLDVPLTQGGQIAWQVDNVLAATGTAWALGLAPEMIRTGLETFTAA